MVFTDLKVCPFCGSKEYEVTEKREYEGKAVKTFEGTEVKSDYTPDKLNVVYGSKAYCVNCKAYLGIVNANKVSKIVAEKFAEGMN